jgi:DNA-directed RNA polymerase alpha subunit
MKSSACPVCPICWPGQRKKLQGDFPEKLSAPALRALNNAGVKSLKVLAKYSENEILGLHGMGPASLPKLRAALKAKKLSFKKPK